MTDHPTPETREPSMPGRACATCGATYLLLCPNCDKGKPCEYCDPAAPSQPPSAEKCWTCGGVPPVSGITCACGGSGLHVDEVQYMREVCLGLREPPSAEAAGELVEGQERACAICGKPAVCYGRYEMAPRATFCCDDCCGHGNEDGWCKPISEPPQPSKVEPPAYEGRERRLEDLLRGLVSTYPQRIAMLKWVKAARAALEPERP